MTGNRPGRHPAGPDAGPLDRLLRPFAEVRKGEAPDALLLPSSVFRLLMAYYIIKVVREPLILAGDECASTPIG